MSFDPVTATATHIAAAIAAKRITARVVRVKPPPTGGVPASEYKLEVVDAECINFLLTMARPGEGSKAITSLAEKRRLYLRWELASFSSALGAPVKVADREPELRRIADLGGDVIITIESAYNAGHWALQVKAVQL